MKTIFLQNTNHVIHERTNLHTNNIQIEQ